MRAAVLRGKHRIELEERAEPGCGDEDVVIAVKAAAICGSDLHGFEGLIPQRRPVGLTMGHEFSGVVAKAGRNVRHVREGDRVAVDPQISCGSCPSCRAGWRNLCDQVQIVGSAMRGYREGANADFVAVPAENAYPIPAHVSFDEAAMGEPAGNAIHLVRRAGVRANSRVVVVGAGAIGLLALQAARHYGAGQVLLVEPNALKRERATSLGADGAFDPGRPGFEEEIRALTGGRGADIILECCGLRSTYALAVRLAAKRAVVGALGYIDEEVPFQMRPLIFGELSVIGSTGFHWPDDPALEMIANGKIEVLPLITQKFSLEKSQQAYEAAPTSIKIIINP